MPDHSQQETPMPCCSWDDARLNRRHGGQCHGFKRIAGVYSGPDRGLAFIGGHACMCAEQTPAPLTFVPAGCALPPWDAPRFCRLLDRRRLLLIGDSTMEQTASVLMNSIALGSRRPAGKAEAAAEGGGGCQTQVAMMLSETLVGQRVKAKSRGEVWTEHVQRVRPDVVVVNAGAHLTSVNATVDFESVLEQVFGVARAKSKGLQGPGAGGGREGRTPQIEAGRAKAERGRVCAGWARRRVHTDLRGRRWSHGGRIILGRKGGGGLADSFRGQNQPLTINRSEIANRGERAGGGLPLPPGVGGPEDRGQTGPGMNPTAEGWISQIEADGRRLAWPSVSGIRGERREHTDVRDGGGVAESFCFGGGVVGR